jgi:hypothetical protein
MKILGLAQGHQMNIHPGVVLLLPDLLTAQEAARRFN